MDLLKYDMTDIWASAGDVVAPDSAKINQGWGVEVVPRQWWNWFENRQDNNIAYILQKGIPEWDQFTEYQINKSYVQRNGIIYRATATSINSDPVALTSWVRAFNDYTAAGTALGALTPAADQLPYFTGATTAALTTFTAFARTLLDDVDAAAMRATLSAQLSHSNLTALSGVTANTNILPYFTGATTMAGTTLTAYGRSLIDDNDATAARTTLGLGNAATQTITSSQTDATVGRLLKVADFGIGNLDFQPNWPQSTLDNCDGVGTGFYRTLGGIVGQPAGYGTSCTVQYYLRLFQVGSFQATQIIQAPASGRMSVRHATGGTPAAPVWGDWQEFWTTANLVKTTSNSDNTAGSMLKVGDFGIGGSSVSILDANAITVGGLYSIPTIGGGGVNGPSQIASVGWMISHVASSATNSFQIASPLTSVSANKGRLFSRQQFSGTWSAWHEFYNTNNTSATIQSLLAAADAASAAAVIKAVAYDVTTGSAQLPVGTTAQRSSNGAGKLRYNSDIGRPEVNNGTAWGSLGGATGGGNDAVFYLNDQFVNTDYTVASTQNAMTAGPITISNGVTVTVSNGAVWTIV